MPSNLSSLPILVKFWQQSFHSKFHGVQTLKHLSQLSVRICEMRRYFVNLFQYYNKWIGFSVVVMLVFWKTNDRSGIQHRTSPAGQGPCQQQNKKKRSLEGADDFIRREDMVGGRRAGVVEIGCPGALSNALLSLAIVRPLCQSLYRCWFASTAWQPCNRACPWCMALHDPWLIL